MTHTLRPDDDRDRVGEEDLAARHDEDFLAAALANHRVKASAPAAVPGMCTNCGEACLPQAVYCDEFCRDDHERVLSARRRTGSA